jgi:hypothetical protein
MRKKRQIIPIRSIASGRAGRYVLLGLGILLLPLHAAAQAPSTYSAYTGTDPKSIPQAPVLGAANSVITDPTFGSRILRATDQSSTGGRSLIPTDAGFFRTWNADSTAFKLEDASGTGYWLEFNPSTFTVGSVPRPLPFDYRWMWSAMNPDLLYYLNGNQLATYNKATGAMTNLGGPPNGDPVTYHAVVVGADQWVCSAAGPGVQDSYTELFCVDPTNPANTKFIDVLRRTINGVPQLDPNWPTSASGSTIGIHGLYGSAAGAWLGVTFHQTGWCSSTAPCNGDAVFDLATNTWSLVTGADAYWSGHVSLGNGKFVNGSGSIDGRDSRGALVRDPDHVMDSTRYVFIMQPPTTVNWQTGEHSSWFNAASNPNAPVLFSRYGTPSSPILPWEGEIVATAVDGSNTVYRFAHHHGATSSWTYYQSAFAQISNDGRWALFSSYWDGTLGASGGDFAVSTRIDTFIVDLGVGPPSAPQTVGLAVVPAGSGSGAVTSSPAGINCGAICSMSYLSGTTVTLNATPAAGSTFIGWGGACGGSGRCTVLANANSTITATFDLSGGGSGEVTPVTWTNLVNVTATGNSLAKTGGCDGCPDAGASSVETIGNVGDYMAFTASETDTLRYVGLNRSDPGTGTSIRFSIRLQSGSAEIRESGIYRADTPFSPGDVFKIKIGVGGVVKYFKNSAMFYKSTRLLVDPSKPLLVDASLENVRATITDVVVYKAP